MDNKIPDFSIIPTAILNDKRITFRALKVYIALKSFMNKETNECFPSRQTISKMTDIPITRISVETDNLEKMGWIKKTGSGGRSTPCVYMILNPPLTQETVTELITVTKSETVTELSGNGYRIGIETVTESVTGKEHTSEHTKEQNTSGADAPPPPPPSVALEPRQQPEKKNRSQKAKEFDLSAIELPEWIPTEIWNRFVAHRSNIRKPLSVNAAEETIKALGIAKNNGWTPEDLISDCIAKGYQGCVYDKHKLPKNNYLSFNQSTNTGGYNGTKRETAASRIAKWAVPGKAPNQRSATEAFEDGFSGRTFEHVGYCAE